MDKLKPALFGGLIVGLLSSIPFVNYCCCIWAIGGGALASYLYIKSSPTPVRGGDGAVLGALAGVIGAALYLIIGLPIAYFFGADAMRDAFARSNMEFPLPGPLLFVVGGLVVGLILLLFSVIGGLIGIPLFEKRKGEAAPPPPPPGPGGAPFAA